MIRAIIVLLYFAGYLLYSLTFRLRVLVMNWRGKKTEAVDFINYQAGLWARRVIWSTGSKVIISGQENIPKDKGVVFIANHQSYLDIPVMIGYIEKPKGFIAKIELLKIPILSMWIKHLGGVFIVRNNPKQSLKAINEGAEKIKKGDSMVIFPEGTRSADGKLGEFKPGSLKLAVKSGAPIVPVVIKGTVNVLPKKKFAVKPSQVEVYVLSPIIQDEAAKIDTNDLTEKIRNAIMEKLK
ncbi:lysophospholipid acyltransferase family protein [Pseudobacteroides cellulosolvens]|uniref:1-acyl-sn-glycerol-3-phosphate acyltransferase n=1 Tax=Pseudobacteroides cellulosolvens ATCC 35603 = DSM 2933 TaxID=398512 RepID=A0A0L6JX36_9FIRM|nr:lysophospholipid acyltransferase family protein [Pseudobacteroides cellulosolvens]KNY30413.1 1-acyl-sn-glycerol-3-phosphate acyltransferase [Pseudobacteroides cellulosolvens ATCC 35603 = DSM 2933]